MSQPKKTRRYTFAKSSRLLHASDFKAVFNNAQLKVSNRYLLLLACGNDSQKNRLGLVIAKKNVRLAVQRNRVKRIIRESFRQYCQLPDKTMHIDIVALARRELDQLDNTAMHALLQQLWKQLQHRAQRKGLVTSRK